MLFPVKIGRRSPPGVSVEANGVNFSVFSRAATRMQLQLYERADQAHPTQVITLHPRMNRTFFHWHVFVEGLPEHYFYTWRADGPTDTAQSGCRFNWHKELVDPWAREVNMERWDRAKASDPESEELVGIRGQITNGSDYDWEGDRRLKSSLQDGVIYEVHVGGFTRHPSADVQFPGCFAGIIEKIPYLQDLGITHVELMPVMAFDPQDVPPGAERLGLTNYWGYSTHSFFAPHPLYCIDNSRGSHRCEFREMVKALHQAGIAVILDVVFNHTAESGSEGPIINFKGLDNEMFYQLDPDDRRLYRDYTGCGNTVNCNHPIVSRFLMDCLEYWTREMHVDGFRFDLASVMARGTDGEPLYHAPLPWNIEFSETLADSELIAEAWDAGGLYQVGGFPGYRWAEWNGRYRDVVRRFVRGDPGLVGEMATRIGGSSDLYEQDSRLPINSINFVTCHDGFTLWDLVSYDRKHNAANGEDGQDGMNDNLSWNCGVEGPTSDPDVTALRRRQAKNFMTILFLSQGVPMLLAGDEMLRSQGGNNNAYNQDNETSWLDWRLSDTNQDMVRFIRELIALRKRHGSLRRRHFLTGYPLAPGERLDIVWHGIDLERPPWDDLEAQCFGFTLGPYEPGEGALHVLLNMSEQREMMGVPESADGRWWRLVDTALPTPDDISKPEHAPVVDGPRLPVAPHSIVVLMTELRSA